MNNFGCIIQNKCVARREESPEREYEGLVQAEPFREIFRLRFTTPLNMTLLLNA